MKKILFISNDNYPDGDAGAVRTHIFAKLFINLGYEPTVVGLGKSTCFKVRTYDGVNYISLRSSSNNFLCRIINRISFTRRLRKFAFDSSDKFDLIIFSGVSWKTLCFLKKWHRKYNIPLIHDSVEWYSHEQFFIGKLHPSYIHIELLNRKYIDSSIQVIAISSYLESHFRRNGVRTIRIPVIMDVNNMIHDKYINEEKIIFVYAGSPGKKDYLNIIISGFAKTNTNIPYELRLIGVTKQQLLNQCGANVEDVKKINDNICCMGRISRTCVLEQLAQADFTVLMRSDEHRYAKAGFPTKFVESLATATPVITNATSDIRDYLIDGENGFLVSSCSSEALAISIRKALNLSLSKRKSMQSKARNTAEKYFDYTKYSFQMSEFIDQ